MKPIILSSKDAAFEQVLIDNGIYPPGYHNTEPGNLEEILESIQQPRVRHFGDKGSCYLVILLRQDRPDLLPKTFQSGRMADQKVTMKEGEPHVRLVKELQGDGDA
jgi:hypothetical protein